MWAETFVSCLSGGLKLKKFSVHRKRYRNQMGTADDYTSEVASRFSLCCFVIYVYIYWEKVRGILLPPPPARPPPPSLKLRPQR